MSSAGCIIIYKELVLLAKRIEGKDIPYSGYWSIFAGSREPISEPPRVCAARELYEETGLKVKPYDLCFIQTLYKGKQTFDIFYYKFDDMPSVNLNFEHTEFGWFDISKLDQFPYPIDEKIVTIIKSI